MWELTRAQKIARLIADRYGSVSRAPIPLTLTNRTPRPTTAERTSKAEVLARMNTLEGELSLLADEQLDALHREVVAKEARAKAARALREELQLPFNLPGAAADYEYWVKADLWTVDEAIALLLGKDPRLVNPGLVKAYEKISSFARRYFDLRRLAERSALMHYGQTKVRQLDVARWTLDAQLEVPHGLVQAMQARYGAAVQSALATTPEVGRAQVTAAAPLATEAAPRTDASSLPSDPKQKRARLLEVFRELGGKRPSEQGKKGTRGALAALERSTGINDKNLGEMLDKAIEEQRATALWATLQKR